MIYYTKDLEQLEVDFDKIQKDLISDIGSQGLIYKWNDECIKFYYSEQPRCIKIHTKKNFEFYKWLNLENYCKLHEEFYREPNLKKIGAYTMEYYEPSDISLLDMPIEYIIENFEIQYRNSMILAENKISTHDLHEKNIIIGDNNMTVIDFDSYYKENILSYRSVLRKNTIILLNLMKKLYLLELKKRNLNNQNNAKIIENLFSFNEDPVKKLKRELHGINKSIDLF